MHNDRSRKKTIIKLVITFYSAFFNLLNGLQGHILLHLCMMFNTAFDAAALILRCILLDLCEN